MILKNNKQNAFTIVELLIVIVVIGILAAISIVSYNGIQNRARDTSVKNSASQVRTKIEAYNSITGGYPNAGDVVAGLDNDDVPEALIDSDVVSQITSTSSSLATSHADATPIYVAPCPATGTTTGFLIQYYQSGPVANNGRIEMGTGC